MVGHALSVTVASPGIRLLPMAGGEILRQWQVVRQSSPGTRWAMRRLVPGRDFAALRRCVRAADLFEGAMSAEVAHPVDVSHDVVRIGVPPGIARTETDGAAPVERCGCQLKRAVARCCRHRQHCADRTTPGPPSSLDRLRQSPLAPGVAAGSIIMRRTRPPAGTSQVRDGNGSEHDGSSGISVQLAHN